MDMKDIRKIIEMMKEHELSEFELQDEGFRIAIKRRNGNGLQHVVTAPPGTAPPVMSPPTAAPLSAAHGETLGPAKAKAGEPPVTEPGEEDEGLVPITCPMVGTFYRSSTPDADPFVSVGSEVDENTVVCIVEAMKVMNEIKAETQGTIRKILLENGAPVQFGQTLFLVEPS